jgi:transposase-like protein
MDFIPAKRYTEEQKQEAIKLANIIGWSKASKQLGINKSTVRKWVDPEWLNTSRQISLDSYHNINDKNAFNKRNQELRQLKKEQIPGYRETYNAKERDRYANSPEVKERHLLRCAEYREKTFKTVNPKRKIYSYIDRQNAIKLVNDIGLELASKQLGITSSTIKRWMDPNHAKAWKAYIKARYDANPHQHTEKCIKRHKERLKTDPIYKMKDALRHRIKSLVKNIGGGMEINRNEIGCTWDEFIDYIESRFTPEMNWDNHGVLWDIDHIKPLIAFGDKILTRDGQLEACHYTNLRPLCCIKNRELNGVYNQLLAEGLSWDQIVKHPLVLNP